MPLFDFKGNPIDAVSYHPNHNLALAIVRAWSEPGYRDRLLTFKGAYTLASKPAADDYSRTSKALLEVGISLAKPVVLTFPQYNAPGYKKVEDEVVFVLPDNLTATGFNLPGAEIAMIVTPLGM